jgi:hypothetical protein
VTHSAVIWQLAIGTVASITHARLGCVGPVGRRLQLRNYPLTTPSGVSLFVERTRHAEAAVTDSISLYAEAASGRPSGSEERGTTPRVTFWSWTSGEVVDLWSGNPNPRVDRYGRCSTWERNASTTAGSTRMVCDVDGNSPLVTSALNSAKANLASSKTFVYRFA